MNAVISDAHIKLLLHKEFEANRFTLLINHLIQKQYNTVYFNGDLLDSSRPTLEELSFVQRELKRLSETSEVIIIAGNHEAVDKNTSVYDLVDLGIKYIPFGVHNGVAVVSWHELLKNKADDLDADVLITHVRSNYGQYIKEEFDIKSLSEKYKLVLLGDIHVKYSPYDNVHYTSSPYSTKFLSPSKDNYGYIEFDGTTFNHVVLDLPNKIKLECTAKEVQQTIKSYKKDLVKLVVTGSVIELNALKKIPGVEMIKHINQTTAQAVQHKMIDPFDELCRVVKSNEIVSSYNDTLVDTVLNKLKGV